MAFHLRVLSLFLLFFLFCSVEAKAQELYLSKKNNQVDDTLRVGLVLSGGGAMGIAHIGVIQAIEEAGIRIDYITGTSMGSLVGGLYAIGYTSDQLAEMATSNNFVELFTEKPDRKYISNYEKIIDDRTIVTFPISEKSIDLPVGIISGQNIYTYLARLTQSVHGIEEFDDFPIPFAAVATDLETGEAKVFRSGYLPDALRASISIPSLFSPHNIDGKLYVDGGLIRNLPVQDAIEMGADYTIAVDVSSPLMTKDSLNTFAKVLNQSIFFRIHDYSDIQREMADYVIRIKELEPYNSADFDMAEEFLEIGRKVGQRHLDEFKKIAARQKASPPERLEIQSSGTFPIEEIVIKGNSYYDDTFFLNQLDFVPGSILDPETIEEKITQLYSSQYIDHVTYRLLPSSDHYYRLQINVVESDTDEFKVGLRYETGSQASILLETNFQNILHDGSLTRFESRLGDRINFQADHIYYGALGSNLALLTTLQYQSEQVNWYSGDTRVSQFRNNIVRAEISGGNYFSTQNLISLGIRRDFTNINNRINFNSIDVTEENYHTLFIRFIRDRLNRKAYPTSGHRLVIEGHYSDEIILSEIDFSSSSLYYRGYHELDGTISLTNSIWLGYTTGRNLPWVYWKSPNRYNPIYDTIHFGGADTYEVSSRNAQLVSLGIQLEPFYHRFIGLELFAGKFEDTWNFDFLGDTREYGISLSVGALTILGPARLLFSGSTINSLRAELQIGYQF